MGGVERNRLITNEINIFETSIDEVGAGGEHTCRRGYKLYIIIRVGRHTGRLRRPPTRISVVFESYNCAREFL